MANKWVKKLGLGMAMIMTVSQMSETMVLAAPESDEDTVDDPGFFDILEEKYEDESETEVFDDTVENETEFEVDYQEEDCLTDPTNSEIRVDKMRYYIEAGETLTIDLIGMPEDTSDIEVEFASGVSYSTAELSEDKKSVTFTGKSMGRDELYLSIKLAEHHYAFVYADIFILENGVLDYGQCGDDLFWKIDCNEEEELVLTISGLGDMYNYAYHIYKGEEAPWKNNYDKLIIEEGVTSIGIGAFERCKGTSLTIPSSVKKIGAYAFVGSQLQNIKILPGTETIGNFAFYQNSELKNIELPSTLVSIGEGGMRECPELTSIEFPTSLKTIGPNAFSLDTGLTSIIIPSSVIEIGYFAFGNNNITSIVIPEGVTTIGNFLFSGCDNITCVPLPSSVTTIKGFEFSHELFNGFLLISKDATYILKEDFSHLGSISSVCIPIGITEVQEKAFFECADLKNVYYEGSEEDWDNILLKYDFSDSVTIHYNTYPAKEDIQAVTPVIDLINEIGEVEYSETCKEKINAARKAYDKLTDVQKEIVANFNSLTTAEKDYSDLEKNAEQEAADLEAASVVENLIKLIGTVTYTVEIKEKIDTAKAAYDALTETQKDLVSNYAILTAAEDEYIKLETANADKKAAATVEETIKAIGTVAYTEESKALIDAARTAYDALSDEQKEQVTNLEVLTKAEEEYAKLQAAAGQEVIDEEAAVGVEILIGEIGVVTATKECKAKIDEARVAYNQLTDTQKLLVRNLKTLTEAEEEYAQLKSIDNVPVDNSPRAITLEDGTTKVVQNGKVVENYTGLAISSASNGEDSWIYIEKGSQNKELTAFVEYDNELFYVSHGVLDTKVNGVQIDPLCTADNPRFYFCSNGMVQKHHEGLAEYDGEWFYIRDGLVQVQMNAFVSYDEGLFAVGAGRIIREYSGLMQDPQNTVDGDWYYFALGQAQTQYTGVVTYDGARFYVQKGKFDTTYTGTCGHDGVSFPVINGSVKDQYDYSGCVALGKRSAENIQEWYASILNNQYECYIDVPNSTIPYNAGTLTDQYLYNGFSTVNLMRAIGGVPSIESDLEYNNYAQYAALVNAANGVLSHYPNKPDGMDDETFQKGYIGSGKSNLHFGRDRLNDAVLSFMQDKGSSNAVAVGHRRWILDPNMTRAGLGYVEGKPWNASAMYVVGSQTGVAENDIPKYFFVSWPSSGYFPVEFTDFCNSWSISLNPNMFDTTRLDPATISVTITAQDGRSQVFLGESLAGVDNINEMIYTISTFGYGDGPAIIFRPGTSIFSQKETGTFKVDVRGLYDIEGNAASLSYDITMF